MKLRDYQKTAVATTIRSLAEVPKVLLVMPTGAGKTIVASHICKTFQPILWAAHQNELLVQAENTLAGIDHKTISIFGTKLHKKQFRLLVIDEVHHEGCKTYRSALKKLNYDLILGITATKHRLDRIPLRFDKIIEATTYEELVKQGYLSRSRLFRVRTPTTNYVDNLIGWVNAHDTYAGSTIFFVKDLAEAAYVQKNLSITSRILSANSDRELRLQQFRDGKLQCLISCLLLTEGVDLPICKTVILRLTNSHTLLSQMIGRAVRVHPGKHHCNIVEPAFLYRYDKHATTEEVIAPNEKYISQHGILKWKTRKVG